METTTSKRTHSRCREWERRRRNKFNDAITKLGQIVKAIHKTNCPDENVDDVQYPKIEIVQKAIVCLTNCAQEKTQLKAEILALQVKLDTVKNQCGNRKDASTQVYFGLTKKHKDGKYVKLLMLKKSKTKRGKEKLIVKETSKNETVQKLPMLLPRTNLADKKGPENTIVVLPAAPYLFPQRPLLFPTAPPAIVLVDSNLQTLNKAVPIVNRNSGDITKTTMVNILPISAYSRPLSATKTKKSSVKLKGEVLKKTKKKSNPSPNIVKETNNNKETKSIIQSTEKDKSREAPINKPNANYDKKDTETEKEAKSNGIIPDTSVKGNKPQAVDTKTDKDGESNMDDKSNKINNKYRDVKVNIQIPTTKDNPKCAESVVKELPTATVSSNVKNINDITNIEDSKKSHKIDNIKSVTENKEKINKLPNILDATLCDTVVDGGNARLELAEEFLATSPTAAFLMSFPLVSGNRADSPAEDCQNTPQSSSIQVMGKDNQRRNDLVPPPGPFFEKPSNSDIKSKLANKAPCNLLNKHNDQQKYVGSIVTKESNTLVTTNSIVTKTTPSITLPNVTHENPFLNLSMPSLISTNCTPADTTMSLDFDCSINKTVPTQSTSYVNSNNFFYKSDPFGPVKSTIYSTSSISSSHEFNGLGLYPCAMEKYPSKNKQEYSSVDDNLMKMGSSRLTYDIDLGWSHKGFDFVNCTTTANTFNKDSLLTTTSTQLTTSYNPFNPDFHIPLVSSTNKKDSSSKPSFTDTISSFYSQPTSLWTDDMPFYTNTNISKNLSSKNPNYPSLEPAQINVKSNSVKLYDTKVAEANISSLKPNNNNTSQQIIEKYTKKSPSKMHINWMTSEIRPMQNNYNSSIHSDIKETQKTNHYNQADLSNKKQDQSDGNYFPISMHNFPTQTGQDEFQVWPSARTLGTTEISIEPPPINLPTLVGDLALGPHDKKKTADAASRAQSDIQNSNFLSVTQLMNRSSENMTSRYHVSNIDTAKSIPVKQNNFISDNNRKSMVSHMENHLTQPCYAFNDNKVANPYENMNQFSHTKAKTNNKTEKSSKTHKNNYSTEALLRGASCTQKVQDTGSSKFMMPTQKYADYNTTQDSSVAQVSHFPPILDYSDNSYASQQFAGTTLYNTTTNTISNSFYSNFMPGSSNLMPGNYASGPFTSEFIDYNQAAECNYTNHKYEELKMRNNTVFQPEKVPSNYKSSRRESAAKHKLECSKKESNKKYQSKKSKINNEIEDWNDPSHLQWQNKTLSKKHSNLLSEELPFPNYVSNQMSAQYQSEFFNSHLMPSNVQSMGHNVDRSLASFPVTSRANFNLSTIFPEITMKVQ